LSERGAGLFTNLGDLIHRDRAHDKAAIIDLSGEAPREYSYGEFDGLVCGVARALNSTGLKRGERVALLAANSAEYFAAACAIMRAGAVAVPVNFKFPRETIHFILDDCGAKFVFCDKQRCSDCPENLPFAEFGGEGRSGFEAFLECGPFESVTPEPREPAMFLYTSGSTGVPKGVVLSHQSHLWVVKTRLGGDDLSRHVFLIAAPMFHMNALALAQLAMAAHAGIVLLPEFDARVYIDAIAAFRCTWLTAVPPMIAMMLREPSLEHADLSSVENIRMGSAPVSESLMHAAQKAFPHASITNAYGTTEAGPVVFGKHPKGLVQPSLSVGYPHSEVKLRLKGEGEPDQGVLEIKCPALMNGYHNRPDLVSPMTQDGFNITGDVFRRDENGFYYFVGRSDDMFVSGGENIYPGDVERMLERHPDIVQACVVPIADEIKGQKPVAFVVPRAGEPLSTEAVKEFALLHAPAYQHPRFVCFMDKLPFGTTNKIDRAELIRLAKERFWDVS
jgi:acyl-CoA synthetase (AMP-forming)/AMP-acid ligase II